MSVAAVKGLLWTAIAAVIAMFMTAASPAFERSVSLALLFGCCVLIILVALWYRNAIPGAEAREEERRAQQLVQLKRQLQLAGEPVAVQASSGILMLVLFICAAVFCGRTAFTNPGIGSISVFAIISVLTVGAALVYLPRVGRPALTIRPDGLAVPLLGFFRWDEIDSIGLQRYKTKGATSHSLDIYVPRLHERESRIHPLFRVSQRTLLRSRPSFIVLHLVSASLPAPLVYALCYELWKGRTGRTSVWTAAFSEHQIEQMRRVDEQLEMLKRIDAEADPAAALKLLDEFRKRSGDPSEAQGSTKPLGAGAVKRRDELFAELRTIGTGDHAAAKKLIEQHTDARSREMMLKLVIFIATLAALAVAGLALFG